MKTPGNKKTQVFRKPWSEQEKNSVLKHLKVFIQMKKVPGKSDIESAMKKEPCLTERTSRNVKDFCYNLIKKR